MNKVIIAVSIFLLVGAYMILQDLELEVDDLEDPGERKVFYKSFFNWIKSLGSNTKNAIGYVVYQNWMPDNETVMDNGRT